MPNTYTQLYIQLVFAVKYRQSLINADLRVPLEKYMTAIVQNNGHKLIAIYCIPDHCHLLIGLNAKQSISDLVREVKANSSKWINEQRKLKNKFNWQEGYGAFSYAKEQLQRVITYILNQPERHRQSTFKQEYTKLLEQYAIDYKEYYLFNWLDR